MTITATPTGQVVVDLYRDIHKGIRAELFALTGEAGSVDPAAVEDRASLARHTAQVVDLLVSHAEHEDAHIQPDIERALPGLAERIATDHEALEGRIRSLRDRAEALAVAPAADARGAVQALYLDLASFTAAYLVHQDDEERVVMPALETVVGPDRTLEIHQAIVGSIPPEEMATSLAVMLPAMNLDDRAELLGGMQAGAPPEVFAGVWSLAGSVLAARDHRALAARLGVA